MSVNRRLFLMGGAAAGLLAGRVRASSGSGHDAIIDRFVRDQPFAGSVTLARRGRIIHQRLHGLADRDRRLPVTATTTFRIGSIAKWFTTLAVLRLVERGRMDLAAPLRDYLPELTGPYGGVALDQLLANTSGIPDRVTQALGADPALRQSREGSAPLVARFGDGPLAFPPGDRFDYAFYNWVLVHAALERVSGRPFEAVVETEVFDPLRLRRTGFVDTRDGDVPGLALAYDRDGARKDARVPPFGGASGNIHADAADLVRAAYRVFDTDRLIGPAMRAQLLRVRVPDQDYALGGRVRMIAGRQVAWETGKVQGYRSHLAHVVGEGRSVLILNNTDLDQTVIGTLVEALLTAA